MIQGLYALPPFEALEKKLVKIWSLRTIASAVIWLNTKMNRGRSDAATYDRARKKRDGVPDDACRRHDKNGQRPG